MFKGLNKQVRALGMVQEELIKINNPTMRNSWKQLKDCWCVTYKYLKCEAPNKYSGYHIRERVMMISPHPPSLSSITGLRSSMNNTCSSKFLLWDTKVLVHKRILPWQQRHQIIQCTFSVSNTCNFIAQVNIYFNKVLEVHMLHRTDQRI